jgi:hypothetical protein
MSAWKNAMRVDCSRQMEKSANQQARIPRFGKSGTPFWIYGDKKTFHFCGQKWQVSYRFIFDMKNGRRAIFLHRATRVILKRQFAAFDSLWSATCLGRQRPLKLK